MLGEIEKNEMKVLISQLLMVAHLEGTSVFTVRDVLKTCNISLKKIMKVIIEGKSTTVQSK